MLVSLSTCVGCYTILLTSVLVGDRLGDHIASHLWVLFSEENILDLREGGRREEEG